MQTILQYNSFNTETLFSSSQFQVSDVKAVGQEASPSGCVLLRTSKTARKRMTAWRNESHDCEGPAISVTSLGAFRSAASRAVLSEKFPMKQYSVPS